MTTAREARGGDPPGAPEPAELELTLEAYRAFFQAAPDGCVVVDRSGRIVEMNDEAVDMFGWPRDELLGRPVETLVPEGLREVHAAHRRRFTAHPERRPMGIGLELRARHRDGTEFPVEIGLSPVEDDAGPLVLAVVHDITDRLRLREFGAGVMQGAEEERQRIARDLHDDTAQRLASLLMRLQMARRSDDPDRREALLVEMRDEILQASEGVRRILRGLRPPALEEVGLVAAVRAHARTVLSDLEVEIEADAADVDALLDADAKLALYRIIQEAVSNITRHAEASTVRIRIATEAGMVRAVVVDDGRGFVAHRGEPGAGRGLGLLGMRERATLLGGRLAVRSVPGEGTRVQVEIPASG